MSSPTWSTVSAHFDECLDLSPDQREAYLADLDARSPELGKEVRSLVASSLESTDFLAGPSAGLAEAAESRLERGELGQLDGLQLGSYRLVRLLGRGGMGAVYLADRVDGQFEHQVAIKLLPLGARNAEWIRRFKDERQILARLQHNNIASLLDGGVAEDGTPYFVMPHVNGLAIDKYCDSQRLPLDKRINLFEQICSAVAYAHQNLVIHRDIKPSNVIVDESGVPKLLDFGIARLTSDTAEPEVTSLRALTPNFASPEHVTGENISTLSDVYSLGALAHKILSGRTPFDLADKTPGEIEASILDREPSIPSRVCVAGRGVSARDLTGDVDNIVLRCLRKDPSRRYASVDALVEDFQRYRNGFPVAAKPATRRYRLSKFIRRHRAGVAAASLLGISVVLGAAGIAWQARETSIEARKSERIAGFLSRTFDAANPFGQWREELTLAELLEGSAERAQRELADEPEVRAEMLRLLGVAQTGLGDYAEGAKLIGLSRDALVDSGDTHSSALAQTLLDLATALIENGDYEQAHRIAQQSADMFLKEDGRLSVGYGDAQLNMGVAASRAGDEEAAEALYQESLSVRRQMLPEADYRIADAESSLGALLAKRGQTEEALRLNRSALEIYEKTLGQSHPLAVRARSSVAAALFLSGEFNDAEREFEQLLELASARVGNEHPESVILLNNLGRVRTELGKYSEARQVLRQAVETSHASFDENHALRLASAANLGSVLLELGEEAEAAELLLSAASGYERVLGDQHPVTIRTRIGLGRALHRTGETASARKLLEAAIALRDTPGMRSEWIADAEEALSQMPDAE